MKVLNKIEADFNDIVANESDIVKDLRIENFSEFKKLDAQVVGSRLRWHGR